MPSPRLLTGLLDLAVLGEDTWTAPTPAEGPPRLFGGQVAAQALRAACLTVPAGPRPHSMHGYFIRPGRPDVTLELHVERTRDGRSFTTRHVTAVQDGHAVFELTASFHADEEGVDWQEPGPDLPGPATEAADDSPFSGFWDSNPFEIRPIVPWSEAMSVHPCWVRLREDVGDDPALHACAITFISDLAVVGSARAPGHRSALPSGASLDHAIWFHRPADANRWMLFAVEPVTNFGARGLARGTLHDERGTLVASIAQEALLRPSGRYPFPPGLAALRDRFAADAPDARPGDAS
jgi:acyl-CoA thioesterase-2